MSANQPNDLALLAARYVVAGRPSDHLVELATELVVANEDAFVELAGASPREPRAELRSLFERALHVSGVELPDRLVAAKLLMRTAAGHVAAKRVDPVDGAAEILDTFYAVRDLLPEDFRSAAEVLGLADLVHAYYTLDALEARDDPEREPSLRELALACAALA